MVAALHLDRQAEGKPGLFPGKCVELKRAGESEPQAGAADEPERRLIAIPDFRFAVFDFTRCFPVSRFSAVNTTMAMSVRSRARCRRYQVVAGTPRKARAATPRRSTMTRARLASRTRMSAACIASSRVRQRTQTRCCSKGGSCDWGSKASRASTSAARIRRSRVVASKRAISSWPPVLGASATTSVMPPSGSPPSPASSIAATPVGRVAAGRGAAWGKRSASRSRSAARLSGEPRMDRS